MVSAQGGNLLGEHLRALRSRAGGSLGDMAVETRVGERYLRELESGARDELPAPVFVKGFIKAYCAYLGVPADEALALYDRERGVPAPGVSRASRALPGKGWAGHPLAISTALVVIFGAGLIALRLGSQPVPTRSSEPVAASRAPDPAARDIAPSAAASQVIPAVAATSTSSEPAPIASTAAPETQKLVVRAMEPTWIRVQMGEGRVVEELLAAGARREWTSDRRFVLTIGNAGGIEIALNGRPLPSLGARGAVIHRLSLPELPGQ